MKNKCFKFSWTLVDADNSNLAFDSPYWAFPGQWKPYTTDTLTNLDDKHPGKDDLPDRLCVGILAAIGFLSNDVLNPRIGSNILL